jgi:hypothetical protein
MSDKSLSKIIEMLESKRQDSISFSKKYKSRDMEELFQYYEGAKWAFDYTLKVINEQIDSND